MLSAEKIGVGKELKNFDVVNFLWMIGKDFNVIINEEEKLGGLEFSQMKAIDFAQCINNCALSEVKFSGSKYTWWNGRINDACIFQKAE